jgi:hypothetical protein
MVICELGSHNRGASMKIHSESSKTFFWARLAPDNQLLNPSCILLGTFLQKTHSRSQQYDSDDDELSDSKPQTFVYLQVPTIPGFIYNCC